MQAQAIISELKALSSMSREAFVEGSRRWFGRDAVHLPASSDLLSTITALQGSLKKGECSSAEVKDDLKRIVLKLQYPQIEKNEKQAAAELAIRELRKGKSEIRVHLPALAVMLADINQSVVNAMWKKGHVRVEEKELRVTEPLASQLTDEMLEKILKCSHERNLAKEVTLFSFPDYPLLGAGAPLHIFQTYPKLQRSCVKQAIERDASRFGDHVLIAEGKEIPVNRAFMRSLDVNVDEWKLIDAKHQAVQDCIDVVLTGKCHLVEKETSVERLTEFLLHASSFNLALTPSIANPCIKRIIHISNVDALLADERAYDILDDCLRYFSEEKYETYHWDIENLVLKKFQKDMQTEIVGPTARLQHIITKLKPLQKYKRFSPRLHELEELGGIACKQSKRGISLALRGIPHENIREYLDICESMFSNVHKHNGFLATKCYSFCHLKNQEKALEYCEKAIGTMPESDHQFASVMEILFDTFTDEPGFHRQLIDVLERFISQNEDAAALARLFLASLLLDEGGPARAYEVLEQGSNSDLLKAYHGLFVITGAGNRPANHARGLEILQGGTSDIWGFHEFAPLCRDLGQALAQGNSDWKCFQALYKAHNEYGIFRQIIDTILRTQPIEVQNALFI